LKTVSAVTTPSGRAGIVVVVVSGGTVGAGASESSTVVLDVKGASVVTESSGPTEMMSPPATHALVNTETVSIRGISLRIEASVGMDLR